MSNGLGQFYFNALKCSEMLLTHLSLFFIAFVQHLGFVLCLYIPPSFLSYTLFPTILSEVNSNSSTQFPSVEAKEHNIINGRWHSQ